MHSIRSGFGITLALLSSLSLLPVIGPLKAEAEEGSRGNNWRHGEIRRFPATEAHQGVAVDEGHFYAITNRSIGKYRKDTGERVAGWEDESGGPIKHLNAGIVIEGKLYAAHSNYPDLPEESSLEVWDVATMKHAARHSFEEAPGSLTWLVPWNPDGGGGWLACFAHYRRSSDPALSRVVRFDEEWKPLAKWAFPIELIERFAGNSSSGGAFGPDGKLFLTGHDATELYVISPPDEREDALRWEATIQISAAGQAFAWDASDPGVLYSISRETREVIVSRITEEEAGAGVTRPMVSP